MTRLTTPHPDLLAAQALAYAPCGYCYAQLQPEAESVDYAACILLLGGLRCCFRVAKITPTKVGQFVTLWKRVGRGPHLGQFVFPKAVLAAQGKRALRVYPPWDAPARRSARKRGNCGTLWI